jgi:hypothetical protein
MNQINKEEWTTEANETEITTVIIGITPINQDDINNRCRN